MSIKPFFGFVFVLALIALGCGTPARLPELESARTAYTRAMAGPAATYEPDQLHVAKVALERAEQAYLDEPDAQSTRDLAYVAQRKVESAESTGRTAELLEQKERAHRQLVEARETELAQTRQQLSVAGQELAGKKQALDAEKKARDEAEARGADVIRKMAATVATSVKSEDRGQVLMFAADGLFESGKAALVPAARVKLSAVADALKTQPGRKILIEGHTDSRGDAAANQLLGQNRAQAVKDHLVSTGLKAELLEVQGVGSSRAIGDNATAEGRASNRRIEIVILTK